MPSLKCWPFSLVTAPSLPKLVLSMEDLLHDVALTDPERQAGQVASASFTNLPKLIQSL